VTVTSGRRVGAFEVVATGWFVTGVLVAICVEAGWAGAGTLVAVWAEADAPPHESNAAPAQMAVKRPNPLSDFANNLAFMGMRYTRPACVTQTNNRVQNVFLVFLRAQMSGAYRRGAHVAFSGSPLNLTPNLNLNLTSLSHSNYSFSSSGVHAEFIIWEIRGSIPFGCGFAAL
jgi:hypothetical protein